MLAVAVGVALVLAVVAFGLRVVVHAGRRPSGVDTWYYLAYANAFRTKPSLDVRLPQYLLQDERQSYPPLFPSLIALLPRSWLDRWFWVVSPTIDCLHLLFLYVVALRLTGSIAVATLAAATYAFTPHLVSETRSLTARPFGALLHTCAMILVLKSTVAGSEWVWALAATAAAFLLFISSAAMAAAFVFVNAAFVLILGDPRHALIPLAGFLLAWALLGRQMLRVLWNYFCAVRYWRRNRSLFGRHPVRDSPVIGDTAEPAPMRRSAIPGLLGQNLPQQILRLVGENPFLLALPLAPPLPVPWGQRMQFWAIALTAMSLIATIVPPLRAFGPGRAYMKAAIFPTAYTLAAGIGSAAGFSKPVGAAALTCLVASAGAIAFFVLHARRRPTEQTAAAPDGLRKSVFFLAGLEPGGVFVLPYMYADYTAYWSGKPVVWGGHCGDHSRFEWIAPVIQRPLPDLFRDLGVRYLLLDERYATAAELRLSPPPRLCMAADGFLIYRWGSEGG